jgi:hypothetical protein
VLADHFELGIVENAAPIEQRAARKQGGVVRGAGQMAAMPPAEVGAAKRGSEQARNEDEDFESRVSWQQPDDYGEGTER